MIHSNKDSVADVSMWTGYKNVFTASARMDITFRYVRRNFDRGFLAVSPIFFSFCYYEVIDSAYICAGSKAPGLSAEHSLQL